MKYLVPLLFILASGVSTAKGIDPGKPIIPEEFLLKGLTVDIEKRVRAMNRSTTLENVKFCLDLNSLNACFMPEAPTKYVYLTTPAKLIAVEVGLEQYIERELDEAEKAYFYKLSEYLKLLQRQSKLS